VDKKELETILADHAKWLSGNGGSRADLSRADLRRTNLSFANLSGANLSEACLSRTNLSRADLSEADLTRTNLTRACLRETNLSGANLSFANLSEANLTRACLREACLSRTNLSRADLSRADLSDNHYVIGCTLSNYPLVAFMQDNELCVTSGCRRGLTIADAREHWSLSNIVKWTQKHEAWGAQRLRQIDFLEAEASHLGWTK